MAVTGEMIRENFTQSASPSEPSVTEDSKDDDDNTDDDAEDTEDAKVADDIEESGKGDNEGVTDEGEGEAGA